MFLELLNLHFSLPLGTATPPSPFRAFFSSKAMVGMLYWFQQIGWQESR